MNELFKDTERVKALREETERLQNLTIQISQVSPRWCMRTACALILNSKKRTQTLRRAIHDLYSIFF